MAGVGEELEPVVSVLHQPSADETAGLQMIQHTLRCVIVEGKRIYVVTGRVWMWGEVETIGVFSSIILTPFCICFDIRCGLFFCLCRRKKSKRKKMTMKMMMIQMTLMSWTQTSCWRLSWRRMRTMRMLVRTEKMTFLPLMTRSSPTSWKKVTRVKMKTLTLMRKLSWFLETVSVYWAWWPKLTLSPVWCHDKCAARDWIDLVDFLPR